MIQQAHSVLVERLDVTNLPDVRIVCPPHVFERRR